MFLLNGSPLQVDVAFSYNGISYPSNWLRLSTPEEKAALGITEIADQVRPDDRYYWVSQNSDGSFTATPKAFEDVRNIRLTEIRQTAYSLLQPTDYKLIRHVETGEAIDTDTTAKRNAIRSAFSANEALITAALTVDDLAALQFTWPTK